MKIANYEKQIVRGTINMIFSRGYLPEVNEVEYMVSKYTINMNHDHRQHLANFIEKEIERIKEKKANEKSTL